MSWDVTHLLQCIQNHLCWFALCSGSWEWPSLLILRLGGGKKGPSIRQKNYYNVGRSELGTYPVHYSSVKGILFKFQNWNRDLHEGTDTNKSIVLLFLRLSSAKLSWKSLMSDYGLRVWISMRYGFPTRQNVFIILCNDSRDNNSFNSEGISIKIEESIKMLYAKIYKLGNFLDYCNHLQNWLFQCGIDRFQQRSLTTNTFFAIYSYWTLN